MSCFDSAGTDLASAAEACADGAALVLFDNNGGYDGNDNIPVEPTSWDFPTGSPLYGPNDYPYGSANPTATWEVDQYTTEDDVSVFAFVCRPLEGLPPFPLQIYNHGGLGDKDTGYGIHGTLDKTGLDVTSDELGLCLNAAQNGWLAAVSSYRGEGVDVVDNSSAGLGLTRSQLVGSKDYEFCLGEVTDVLALLDHFLNVTICGPPIVEGHCTWHPLVNANQVLMWGWSHGGCVTQRAVEQGAPVTAAATFAAVADDTEYYDFCTQVPNSICDQVLWAGMHKMAVFGDNTPAGIPMAYNWRSPTWFESLAVGALGLGHESAYAATANNPVSLKARSNVPLLMLQGGSDEFIPTDAACKLSVNIGSSCSNWYYSAQSSWIPGSAADPQSPFDQQIGWANCANLGPTWQLINNSSNNGVVDNWSANWNLVWLDDDDHVPWQNETTGVLHNGVLNDQVAWENFYSFVYGLHWSVQVSSSEGWFPAAPPNQVMEMTLP